jgi:hypothetical protein
MPKVISRRRFVRGSIRLAVVSPIVQLAPLEVLAQEAVRFGSPERRTLKAVADVIVPAQDRMPAASAVGAASYVERIAGFDSKLGELLIGGLQAIEVRATSTYALRFDQLPPDSQTEIVAEFEKRDPPGFFPALRDLVYEAYYTQPRVMRLIGYNFRSGRRRTAPIEAFDERSLARVRTLPPLYREVQS